MRDGGVGGTRVWLFTSALTWYRSVDGMKSVYTSNEGPLLRSEVVTQSATLPDLSVCAEYALVLVPSFALPTISCDATSAGRMPVICVLETPCVAPLEIAAGS